MNALALFEEDSKTNLTKLDLVLDRFLNNLPHKPYCADNFEWGGGLKIRSKSIAITKPYIQFNHPNWKKYIILDIDNPGAVSDWIFEKSHLPAPNLVIENKKNGRAHFVFELIDAVSFTAKSSLKAQNYYTAVSKSLTEHFDADQRYTGLICKNPFSSQWRISSFKEEPYHLKELADKLELPSLYFSNTLKKDHSANDDDLICGRNDGAFHSVRKLAYKDIKDFKENGGRLFDLWFNHVLNLVKEKNTFFTKPMDYKECFHIAKSISKFCWNKHDECVERFKIKQSERASKAGKKRSAQYEGIRKEAKRLFRSGSSVALIAEKLKVSVRSIQRYTKGLNRLKLLTFNDINKARAAAVKVGDSAQNQVIAAVTPLMPFNGIRWDSFISIHTGAVFFNCFIHSKLYLLSNLLVDKHKNGYGEDVLND